MLSVFVHLCPGLYIKQSLSNVSIAFAFLFDSFRIKHGRSDIQRLTSQCITSSSASGRGYREMRHMNSNFEPEARMSWYGAKVSIPAYTKPKLDGSVKEILKEVPWAPWGNPGGQG